MEGADEVFAGGVVDAGFPADAGVDHREERGGDLDERDAAQDGGGDEARHVADDAPSQRQHRRVALDALGQQRVVDRGKVGQRFMVLAGGKGCDDGLDAGLR